MAKEAAEKVIEDGEKELVKDSEEFNKERQRADQEAANAARAREQATAAAAGLESAKAENASMREKLAEMQAEAAKGGVPDLDPEKFEDLNEKTLASAIKGIQKALDASNARVKTLEGDRNQFVQDAAANKAAAETNKAYNDLLSDLDEDYGAEHRNAAIKAFTEKRTAGKVPADAVKATRIMEKCYKDAAKAAEAKANETKGDNPLNLDTGYGGGNPNLAKMTLQKGSLEEVSAQVKEALT